MLSFLGKYYASNYPFSVMSSMETSKHPRTKSVLLVFPLKDLVSILSPNLPTIACVNGRESAPKFYKSCSTLSKLLSTVKD